jgi:capsid protein
LNRSLLTNGKIAKKLVKDIRRKFGEWSVRPEVTNQFTRPMLERLMLRTWLRDGEVFAQLVSGTGNGLQPVLVCRSGWKRLSLISYP